MIQCYFQINSPSINVSIQTDSEFANQLICYLKTKTITYLKLNTLQRWNIVYKQKALNRSKWYKYHSNEETEDILKPICKHINRFSNNLLLTHIIYLF